MPKKDSEGFRLCIITTKWTGSQARGFESLMRKDIRWCWICGADITQRSSDCRYGGILVLEEVGSQTLVTSLFMVEIQTKFH